MFHEITIVGRLGRDPELRHTKNGVAVVNMSIAAENPKSGTLWFRVTAWGNLAEVCAKYLKKGRLVLVKGELGEPEVWTDKAGLARASLVLTARTVRFLDGNGKREEAEEEINF